MQLFFPLIASSGPKSSYVSDTLAKWTVTSSPQPQGQERQLSLVLPFPNETRSRSLLIRGGYFATMKKH